MLNYIEDRTSFTRRKAVPVQIGNFTIGDGYPILVQSMTNTNTRDIEKTVTQSIALANAGCELIRITAPTVKDSQCLEHIVYLCRKQGVLTPFCADIHFQPKAAFEALKWVEKVRINPGNFVDTKTGQIDYTEADFLRGEQKVYDSFSPFVKKAKQRGVVIRIGTNHGSLSDRMMARYGDTIEGMVESALEFLHVCEVENFHQVVFSMKSSNSRIVIQAYRLLVARLKERHLAYPLHLGVTEAGDGLDGRLKSAAGIGALLLDGIGDTIRVSLTENPIHEIPVAQALIKACQPSKMVNLSCLRIKKEEISFYSYHKRTTPEISIGSITIGGKKPIAVGTTQPLHKKSTGYGEAEWSLQQIETITTKKILETSTLVYSLLKHKYPIIHIQISHIQDLEKINLSLLKEQLLVWSIPSPVNLTYLWQHRLLASWLEQHRKNYSCKKDLLLLDASITTSNQDKMLLTSIWSSLLNDGYGDALLLNGRQHNISLAFDILQAASVRHSKANFISCPSCGRTLFDLEETTKKIKSLTAHLSEISIAIMGCIVNGPGEMADADFGYVGGAPGKVNLYIKQHCVQKGIPEKEAPNILVELIKHEGYWIDPN